MGYVPIIEKIGFELKKEETELTRKVYVRTDSAIWINEYNRIADRKSSGFYSAWNLVRVYKDRDLSIDEINAIQKENDSKAIAELTKNNEKIAGFKITPPSDLSYKDLVTWYENSILGVIKKQTELAIKLGKDPKEVGNVVVQSTQLLVQTSTAVFAVVGAASGATVGTAAAVTAGATALAGAAFAAVFPPIAAGVLTLVGLLNTLGVFDGDTSQQEEDATTYSQLTFVLKKWYEEYARALSKLNAIDAAEFQKYMASVYGQGNGNSNSNTSLYQQSSIGNESTSFNLYWLILLALIVLIILIRKRRLT